MTSTFIECDLLAAIWLFLSFFHASFFPACRFLLSLSAHTFMMWAYARQNSNKCTSHGELEVIKISFALNLCIFLSRPTTKRPKACHRTPLYLFSLEAIKRVLWEGASQCEGHEAHPMNRAQKWSQAKCSHARTS